MGVVIFSNIEGSSVKPDGVASHIFGYRCKGKQTRRTDKSSRFPGNVGKPGMSFFLAGGEKSHWECEGGHKLVNFFLGKEYLSQLATEAFGVDGSRVQFRDGSFRFDKDGARLGAMIERELTGCGPLSSIELDAGRY